MEHQPRTPEPERQPSPEITSGEPYILLKGGLVINNPGLPIIDLDLLEADALIDGDPEQARYLAGEARRFGLNDIAKQFETFAEFATEELGRNGRKQDPDSNHPEGSDGTA